MDIGSLEVVVEDLGTLLKHVNNTVLVKATEKNKFGVLEYSFFIFIIDCVRTVQQILNPLLLSH